VLGKIEAGDLGRGQIVHTGDHPGGDPAYGHSVVTTLQMAMKWITLAMTTMTWKNS
jgi:hypothetical protein